MSNGGHLELNPEIEKTIQLAGPDKSFFISCLPHSSNAPLADSRVQAKELRWMKFVAPPIGQGWVVMGSEPHERVHVEQSSDGRGLDLVFRSLKSSDGGKYACEATLDEKDEHRPFQLNVIESISFSSTPRVQSVEEDTSEFTLSCLVSGNPKPTVTWNVKGHIVRPESSSEVSMGRKRKYEAVEGGLIIRNVTKADQGSYKCKARQLENGVTDFKDIVLQLKVQHMPEWPSFQPVDFYGFISGIANMTCQANAEPPADFEWTDQNGKDIADGIIMTESHISTLMLPITHDTLFGKYRCRARNKMGSIERLVTLREGAKPGIPKLEVQKIEQNSVHFTILENHAEMFLDIVGFRLEYSEKPVDWSNCTIVDFPKRSSVGGSPYLVRGLRPETSYFFRALARNVAGMSDPSHTIHLQTKKLNSGDDPDGFPRPGIGRGIGQTAIGELTGGGVSNLPSHHQYSKTFVTTTLLSCCAVISHLILKHPLL